VLLTLIGLVVPLGLDTFSMAAALGLAGLPRTERLRVSLLFTAFEMGMPLVGLLGGGAAGRAAGDVADYLAIAILIGLGLFVLWPRAEEPSERVALLARTRGLAAVGLGISVSLDELAIGFTLGLLQLPVLLAVLLIGLQAFAVTQLGIRLGSRLGASVREVAERLAGAVLTGLGAVLLAEKLLHLTR